MVNNSNNYQCHFGKIKHSSSRLILVINNTYLILLFALIASVLISKATLKDEYCYFQISRESIYHITLHTAGVLKKKKILTAIILIFTNEEIRAVLWPQIPRMLFKLTSGKENGIMDGKVRQVGHFNRYPFLTTDLDSKHQVGKPISRVRS